MNRTTLDLWVGFLLQSGSRRLFLALKVGNLSAGSFASNYAVEASFDNIGGLKARAPVKSAGVVVGRVASIEFDPQTYRANVELAIDSRYDFRAIPSPPFSRRDCSASSMWAWKRVETKICSRPATRFGSPSRRWFLKS